MLVELDSNLQRHYFPIFLTLSFKEAFRHCLPNKEIISQKHVVYLQGSNRVDEETQNIYRMPFFN